MKKNNTKPTIIDLFCGAGGLSEGFQQAGYKVLLGLDNIKVFTDTFRINHKNAKGICGDIRKITVSDIKRFIKNKKVDVVIGGPPCQGFSMAGRRDQRDPRNSLFKDYVRIVNGLKPKYFVMENVRGILSMKTAKGTPVSEIIESEFKKIGYSVNSKVLTACDYGVPQKRQRVIFIGTNTKNQICYPQPTHYKKSFIKKSGESVKKYVGVGKVLFNEKKINEKYFHSQKMIDGFRKRKEKNLAKGNGFGAQYLDPNKPSYTISARYWKDGSDALVKYTDNKIRMLTPRECARIQSFPDHFKFAGSKKEIYTQIGNAVPPLMAKAIALEIKKSLTDKIIEPPKC